MSGRTHRGLRPLVFGLVAGLVVAAMFVAAANMPGNQNGGNMLDFNRGTWLQLAIWAVLLAVGISQAHRRDLQSLGWSFLGLDLMFVAATITIMATRGVIAFSPDPWKVPIGIVAAAALLLAESLFLVLPAFGVGALVGWLWPRPRAAARS